VTAVLKYTVLRIGLFAAALVILTLLGARELGALVGAAVISLLLSYVLLRGPREAAARAVAERTRARLGEPPADGQEPAPRRPHLDDDSAAEDAALDGDRRP
jgi:hypothetical protein